MVMGPAEYPFIGYNLYKIWHQNEGRYYAILYPNGSIEGLARTTITWAKYLMCVKLGRVLSPDEEVDHIDNDKTNDSIDNLQILTRTENLMKENLYREVHMVYLRCPWCGKLFFKKFSKAHVCYGISKFTACSRSCSAKFGALMQYYPDDPRVAYGINNNIVLRYVRKVQS